MAIRQQVEGGDEELLARMMEQQRARPGMVQDLYDRLGNSYGALTAGRQPLNDPELYLDQSQVPREGYGATAIKNLVSAAMEAAPDNSVEMSNGVRLDPTMWTGAIGKFGAATKKGNVLHAANEFQPLLKEQAAMRVANRDALRGIDEFSGPSLAYEKKMFEFPDVDVNKFNGTFELGDLGGRVQQDFRKMYPKDSIHIPSHARLGDGSFSEDQIKDFIRQSKKLEKGSDYLWPSPELEEKIGKTLGEVREKHWKSLNERELKKEAIKERRAFKGLSKEPDPPELRWGEASEDAPALTGIAFAAAKNEPTGIRLFLEAYDQGKYEGLTFESQAKALAKSLRGKKKK